MAGLVLVMLLLAASPAAAQERQVILLASVAEQALGEQVAEALRGQLVDTSAHLEVAWTASLGVAPQRDVEHARAVLREWPSALAAVWVVRAPTGLHLYMLDPAADAAIIRRMVESAAAAENVALIVAGFVAALEERAARPPLSVAGGAEGEVAREASAEPVPPLAAAQQGGGDMERFRLLLGMGWQGAWVSPSTGDNHGLQVSAEATWGRTWCVSVDYAFLANIEHTRAGRLVTLSRHPLTVSAHLLFGATRWQWGGGLAAGVDFLTETIFSTDASRRLRRSDHQLFIVTPTASSRYQLSPRAWLEFALGAEVSFLEGRFGDAANGGPVVTFLPLRPVAHGLLTFALE